MYGELINNVMNEADPFVYPKKKQNRSDKLRTIIIPVLTQGQISGIMILC